MKYPSQRATLAVGKTKNGFAIYKSMRDCVADFKIYELYYLKDKNREQYIKYLKSVYSNNSKNYKLTLGRNH